MKKFWVRSFAILAAITFALVAAFMLYLRHPLFGALPQGDRLVRIEASPNYAEGAFQNLATKRRPPGSAGEAVEV